MRVANRVPLTVLFCHMKNLTQITIVLFALLIGSVAFASNDMKSYELPWTNGMNQETYWEDYFGSGTECTKYSNHSGWIPAQYESAVIKDGADVVKVYESLPSTAFQATGAVNPNNGKTYGAPHSWVMKCNTVPLPEVTGVSICPDGGVYWISEWTVPDGFVLSDLRYTDNGDGTYTGTHQWNEESASILGYIQVGEQFITLTAQVNKPDGCTLSTTTTTTTEVPPSTSTTSSVPVGTTTTLPATTSTTTVPPVSTTTSPGVTAPTTTVESSTSTSSTTTSIVAVTTPPVPPTTQPAPETVELPPTGSGALWMTLIGAILVGSGLLARRTARGESSTS